VVSYILCSKNINGHIYFIDEIYIYFIDEIYIYFIDEIYIYFIDEIYIYFIGEIYIYFIDQTGDDDILLFTYNEFIGTSNSVS
ncbi:Hypothetical protein HVR_LOCUS137, partial [uncultured virus]